MITTDDISSSTRHFDRQKVFIVNIHVARREKMSLHLLFWRFVEIDFLHFQGFFSLSAIALGMKKINDENLAKAYRLIESNSFDDEQQFSTVLDSLNPAQCFDIFERLCTENRW